MAQTVMFLVVLVLVFVLLPVILKRLTGRDYIELLVGRPLFGKKKTGDKTADPSSSYNSREGGKDSKEKKEKNSTKADILQTVSDVASFARRNQYYAIIPGVLRKEALETKLPAILVMRSGVVGINLFGYGGAVSAKKDDPEWTQTINGETRSIPSPLAVSENMRKVLAQILREIGYPEVEVSVISAFTQKDVRITGPSSTEVVLSRSLIGELGKSRYVRTKDVDVKQLGEALAYYQVRNKK